MKQASNWGLAFRKSIRIITPVVVMLFLNIHSAKAADCNVSSSTSTPCTLGTGDNATISAGVTLNSGGGNAVVGNGSPAGTLTNSGTLTSSNYTVYVNPGFTLNAVTNASTGIITNTGGAAGIGLLDGQNSRIGSITNQGSVSGGNTGVYIGPGDTLGSIQNGDATHTSATLAASFWFGFHLNNATLTNSFTNYGTVSGGSNGGAAFLNEAGTVGGSVINYGMLKSGTGGDYRNSAITNTGTITGQIVNNAGATISGIATAGAQADGLNNIGTISTTGSTANNIDNSGTITGYNHAINNSGTINGYINNTGAVNATASTGLAVNNTGTVTGGVINGAAGTMTGGIKNTNAMGSISNSGSIDGSGNSAITNTGTINTVTNTGSMASTVGHYADINNTSGSISTLINSQGSSNSNGSLTYAGNLPSNYQIIVNSQSNYGQLAATGTVSGTMAFGVNSASTLATLGAHVYTNALSGLSGSYTISNAGSWNAISATNYYWGIASTGSGNYNLNVAQTINTSGSTYQTSNLNTTVYPKFDGGTLQVSSAGTYANNFTVTNNNGVIDQSGRASTFSGAISNDGSSVGAISIVNNGTAGQGSVALSGNNTYSGGTTVNAGANLILTSGGALGSGALALVGNSTTPATLTTSGNMSISNAISVTGDPVFNVTSGTTTVNSAITGSGDVVVSGAGTLALTQNNTYSGPTTINSGATLALSGSGAIGSSSAVTANGTFDISSTTAGATVQSLAGSGSVVTASGKNLSLSNANDTFSGVVSGAGGLTVASGAETLAGANTYTGSTTINSGATLALSGSGAIGSSAQVTNNGRFNITASNGNVALRNFTQTSTGNTVMSFAASNNQQINVTGTTSLSGTLTLSALAGSYTAGRYTLLTSAGGVSGTFGSLNASSLASYTNLGYSLSYDANDVYLLLQRLGPSAANTLQSVQANANGLSTIYNQQAAAYQAALSYDCQVYDEMGLCVSVGGRYTYAGPSPSSNQQAGLVVLGYKPIQTLRMGAFADQSVNISTPSGFSQSKSSPMWGLFAKWHMNKDESGLGVQASAVTSASKLTTTRAQLTDTETGSGSTQFNGQGYQLTTNYHQPVTDNTSLVPYVGLRYTRINAGAYTENATATVTSPLSYNAMAQNTFSAIGGVGVRSHLAEKLIGTASVGIQQNLKYSMGNYAGTSSISGLESFSVQMPGNVNSMATATAGLYYDVRKNERVGVNVLWQQQPFIATNTTTALATYTIGF